MIRGLALSQIARFCMLIAFAATFSFSTGVQELTHQYFHSLIGSDCEVDFDYHAHIKGEEQISQETLSCDFYLFLVGLSRDVLLERLESTVDYFVLHRQALPIDHNRVPYTLFLTNVSARGPPGFLHFS